MRTMPAFRRSADAESGGWLPCRKTNCRRRGIYHKHDGKIRSVIDSNSKVQSFKQEDIEEISPSKNWIIPGGLATAMTL
jgi:hypothetical protein